VFPAREWSSCDAIVSPQRHLKVFVRFVAGRAEAVGFDDPFNRPANGFRRYQFTSELPVCKILAG